LSADTEPEELVGRLLQEFRLYDRNVDVVSAWETIFTRSLTDLPAEVVHFERFPSIAATDGRPATPDFTVLFSDLHAIVGEIANFGQADGSVDALCEQITRYEALVQMPAGGGSFSAVPTVDVMLFVPLNLGTSAIRRIIGERYAQEGHFYKPSVPPVIVQFTLQTEPEAYVFQRRPEAENGMLRDQGLPSGGRLSTWFSENDVTIKPERFREIKVARAFMNDPIPPLYLATFLWAKIFADRAAKSGEGRPVLIDSDPVALATQLRNEYGVVRASDVRAALALLERARLAERSSTGWTVYWTELKSLSDRDLAATLAQRSVRPPSKSVAQAVRERPETEEPPRQEPLF
jgi:hypothetical protein